MELIYKLVKKLATLTNTSIIKFQTLSPIHYLTFQVFLKYNLNYLNHIHLLTALYAWY